MPPAFRIIPGGRLGAIPQNYDPLIPLPKIVNTTGGSGTPTTFTPTSQDYATATSFLIQLGYLPAGAQFSSAALAKFQGDQNMPATGVLDQPTADALLNASLTVQPSPGGGPLTSTTPTPMGPVPPLTPAPDDGGDGGGLSRGKMLLIGIGAIALAGAAWMFLDHEGGDEEEEDEGEPLDGLPDEKCPRAPRGQKEKARSLSEFEGKPYAAGYYDAEKGPCCDDTEVEAIVDGEITEAKWLTEAMEATTADDGPLSMEELRDSWDTDAECKEYVRGFRDGLRSEMKKAIQHLKDRRAEWDERDK